MSITASTHLQTLYGDFIVQYHRIDENTCVSLYIGDPTKENILVRLQSSCLFSESFHTIDCDCNLQLTKAMEMISKEGNGVIVYSYEEGRGYGLEKKIQSVELERLNGIDTVEAFNQLGLEMDPRDYKIASEALRDLKVNSRIRLLSGNPHKKEKLEENGFEISEMIEIKYPMTKRLKNYLRIKKEKLGHKVSSSLLE